MISNLNSWADCLHLVSSDILFGRAVPYFFEEMPDFLLSYSCSEIMPLSRRLWFFASWASLLPCCLALYRLALPVTRLCRLAVFWPLRNSGTSTISKRMPMHKHCGRE